MMCCDLILFGYLHIILFKCSGARAMYDKIHSITLCLLYVIRLINAEYVEPSFTYHNHDALTQYLQLVHEEYSEITHLYSTGTSVEGELVL